MSNDCLNIASEGRVRRLTLNQPRQGNACSSRLVRALTDAMAAAEAESVDALVLRGEGRHFCTGFDLSALEQETDDSLLARFVRIELLLQRIARAPFLTAAIAHGRTMGAGADLLAACDLRIALAGATFAFPGASGFGLLLGSRRLAQRVGAATALDWITSGRAISAEEALARGLVTAIAGTPAEAEELLAARIPPGGAHPPALRQALAPAQAAEDAADLSQLVLSAAQPGLHARIAAYVARVNASRAAPAS